MRHLCSYVKKGRDRMELPNGVTGFYDREANKPPQVDGTLFKQLCFSILSHGGKVIDFKTPQYPANYYYARVEMLGNPLYILLNEHYPYLAFASDHEYRNITFIDAPALHAHFSPFYQVLGKKALNKPLNLSLAMKTKLNNAELKQIEYWKPKSIGQIIFNYWD